MNGKTHSLPDITHNNRVVQEGLQRLALNPLPADTKKTARDPAPDDDDGDVFLDNDAGSVASSKHSADDQRLQGNNVNVINKTEKGVYLATAAQTDVTKSECTPEPWSSGSDSVRSERVAEETDSERLAKLQIQYQRRVMDREGRKTIAEELDDRGRRDLKFTVADLDPTVIEVQVLERGQYFGVTAFLFPDQPSLSVVSNGAECLVMSKRLFLQYADEKCLRHLRQTESPFPSDVELGEKLQETVNWRAGRASIYQRLQDDITRRQSLRRQFSSMPGQYCFRTGPT